MNEAEWDDNWQTWRCPHCLRQLDGLESRAMTDRLRTLAEAEAKNEFHPNSQLFNLYDSRYVRGFIAGRTSVTLDDVVSALVFVDPDLMESPSYCRALADEIMARIRGEEPNDD